MAEATTEELRELHRLQEELQAVRTELDRGPKRIAAAQKKVDKKQQEFDDQKEAIINLKKSSDERSLQLKTNEAKILELQGKLNQASSNREYDIIKSQIDADKMANSVLEDEILESLEKIDVSEAQLKTIENEMAEAGAKKKETESAVQQAEAGLQQQAEELTGKISSAETVIPAILMDTYRRLVQKHAAGALSAVDEGGACTSCYSLISPQEGVLLNTGKIILCRHCGRIMYRAAKSEART